MYTIRIKGTTGPLYNQAMKVIADFTAAEGLPQMLQLILQHNHVMITTDSLRLSNEIQRQAITFDGFMGCEQVK